MGAPGYDKLEARLTRLERTVDKLVAAVDRSLGPVEPDPATVYAVPIDPRDPIEGPADARVTIVVAFELMDPFSAVVIPALAQVAGKHPADVRVVWKYLLVHGTPALGAGLVTCGAARQHAWPAVRAALVARLYTGQPPQPHPELGSYEQLRPVATQAGLDVTRLDADRPTCDAWFAATRAALEPIGIRTTPAIFINGRHVGGARDAAALEGLVAAALVAAGKRIAEGVAPAELYQREVVDTGAKHLVGRFE